MNTKQPLKIIASVLAILMVIIGVVVLFIRLGTPGVTGSEIMIVASNAFQLALIAVLFVQNCISRNSRSVSSTFFSVVLFIVCVKIFTDQVSWAVDGNTDLIWLNWTVCTLTYLCTAPILIFFWNYCSEQLNMKEKERLIINRILIVLGIVITLLFLTNPLTRIFFYIDADGWFVLAPTGRSMIIQNFLCSIFCIIAVLKSNIIIQKKILLTIVFVTPFFGIILGTLSKDFVFLQYLCLSMAIFFCYISVFTRGEDEYQAKLRELDMATAIQRGALREDFGDFGDHKIYAYMKPAREVGGDFYDFFNVGENTTGVLIADVSGKGIPAAMFMMQGLSAIRELAKSGMPINEVFENANNLLCAHNDNEFFITAWMAYINRKTGEVTYVNAGHNPPIIKRADGNAEYVKCKPGMVLAAMEDLPYRVNKLDMTAGDTLFMYTDGIPEAQTKAEELYGEERLISLARNAGADPEELTITILNGVNSFVGQAEQFDDMTIISYERE